jgi:hypothetical protein
MLKIDIIFAENSLILKPLRLRSRGFGRGQNFSELAQFDTDAGSVWYGYFAVNYFDAVKAVVSDEEVAIEVSPVNEWGELSGGGYGA